MMMMAVAAFTVHATARDVYFDLSKFNASPATNRTVELRPLSPFPGNVQTYVATNGTFWVSNMAAGDWNGVIKQRGAASSIEFQISVPSEAGTSDADAITALVGIQTYPTTGRTAWTIQASDARYAKVGSGGLAFVPQPASATLTNLDANAGSAAYSNANAFTLAPTNTPVADYLLAFTGDGSKTKAIAAPTGGTSGALTNNETRAVTFENSVKASALTAGGLATALPMTNAQVHLVSRPFEVRRSDGTLNLSVGYNSGAVYGNTFYGDGSGLTNLTAAVPGALTNGYSEDATFINNVTASNFVGSGEYLRNLQGPAVEGVVSSAQEAVSATIATNAPNGISLAALASPDGQIPQIVTSINGISDIEDAASVSLLAKAHRQGMAKLIALGIGGGYYQNILVGQAAQAILSYHDCGRIPIGIYTNAATGTYPSITNALYPNGINWPNYIATNQSSLRGIKVNAEFETYSRAMRRALASSESNSVYFHINEPAAPLTNFLMSAADDISPLTGAELLKRACKKIRWMSGDYPNSITPAGLPGEYNINVDPSAFTNALTRIRAQGIPIDWIGFTIGTPPIASAAYPTWLTVFPAGWTNADIDNPCYNLSYNTTLDGDVGRPAWSSVSFLTTILGDNSVSSNLFTWSSMAGSNVIVTTTGSNYWQGSVNVGERYLSSVNTNEVQRLLRYYTEREPKARITGDIFSGNIKINSSSTNALSVMTNALVVDSSNGRVRVGAAPASGEYLTNRFMVIGRPAGTTAGDMETIDFLRPVNAGNAYGNGLRIGLGRYKDVSAFSADTLVRFSLSDFNSSQLDDRTTWTQILDLKKTNAFFNVPLYGSGWFANYGSTSQVGYGFTNDANTGIYRVSAGIMGLVAGGTEAQRIFGDDTYMPGTGYFFWINGAYGNSVDVGLGRNAAGVIEINNGTPGTLRDLTARTVTATTHAIGSVTITSGTGSPESVVTAPVGSLFLRTDGSTSTTLYVKTSGSGNTGWTAK